MTPNFDPEHLREKHRIADRLRACATAEDVEAVAGEEREAVKEMREGSPESRALAIQLANLKKYRLWEINGG